MYICENCNIENLGNYGSKRFCSERCARSFSTKKDRDKINEMVSDTLIRKNNNGLNKIQVLEKKGLEKHASYIRKKELMSLFDLSSRTISKILIRLELPCSNCNWYKKGVSLDLHHIIERKNGGNNMHTNLSYLCPNCHRCVHSDIIKKNDLITLDLYIGNKWKDFYYIKKK